MRSPSISNGNHGEKKIPTKHNPSVLIILPVLNEKDNIDPLIEGIRRELVELDYTICIIDDGSVDGTLDRIRVLMDNKRQDIVLLQGKKLKYGCQRGGALKRGLDWGLESTDHGIFVEMDGDQSHRPEELKIGIQLIESGEYDVVIGSKYVAGGKTINRSVGRNLVSLISSIAMGLAITPRIRDYSNGYRFYTRRAAEIVEEHEIKYHSPIYLSEVLAIWLTRGLRIIEFPTIYIGRNEGLSKVRWIDLAKGAIAALEIAWRYRVIGFK